MQRELLGPVRGTNLLGFWLDHISRFRRDEMRMGWDYYDFRPEAREITLVLYCLRWEVAFTVVLRDPRPLDWDDVAHYRAEKRR